MSRTSGSDSDTGMRQGWLAGIRWEHAILAALILGCLLRLIHFGFGRMLWLDEAMVAINLEARSGAELLAPLDFRQIAPTGWLLMVDGFASVLGSYEYGARLPSLLAGLLSLLVFFKLSKAEFSPPVAFISTLAFAVAFMLVYFSAELKPYAFDVLLWTLTAAIALRLERRQQASVAALVVLSLVFILGAAFTFSAPAIIGGIGAVLILRLWTMGERRSAAIVIIGACLAGALYLALAVNFYQQQVEYGGLNSGDMGVYFDKLYAPFPPTSLSDLVWYPQLVNDTAGALFGIDSAYIFIVLSVLGGVSLARSRGWTAALLLAPLCVSVLLSALHIYPIMPRLVLYFIPVSILLSCYAIESLCKQVPHLTLPIVVAAIALMSIGSIGLYRYENTFNPRASDKDLSTELETIARLKQAGDVVAVTTWSIPVYLLYRHSYGLQDASWAIVDHADCLVKAPLKLENGTTVWLIKGRFDGAGLPSHSPRESVDEITVTVVQDRLDQVRLVSPSERVDDAPSCPRPRQVEPWLAGGTAPLGAR